MRSSGILMHITSLPGPYGIGTMGAQAFAFVDFLKAAGQSCWQLLPLTPTGYGDSPYQSCSTYAGNHYLIDLDLLVEEGLLRSEELSGICWAQDEDKVDFGIQYYNRLRILRLAYSRFADRHGLEIFRAEQAAWLEDFALYMALKDHSGGKPWYQWEQNLKFREKAALEEARETLGEEIGFWCFVQYLFSRQWNALRGYASSNGIRIIGDVPIYVPLDSVEVWCEPELFQLDETLTPTAVAGCPPDAFSADGQLWGNPLYRWEAHKAESYRWWIRRLTAAGQWYDVIRIDHFRGFESYWAIPYGDTTACNGRWVKGPDRDLIDAVRQALPEQDFIAEDLGYLTPEVLALREASGYPGMKILQFAFDPREPSNYLPYTYTRNSVCYTGTHDNLTMRQWFETAEPEALEFARAYMNLREDEDWVQETIRTAFASVSNLCVVQMQDLLNLDGKSRMNCPGTLSDCNWTWRMKNGIINHTLSDWLLRMTTLYARLGD